LGTNIGLETKWILRDIYSVTFELKSNCQNIFYGV